MRKFDELGLQLVKSQANIFEESLSRYKGSSAVFIRNYMYSEEVGRIDRYLEFDSTKINNNLNRRNLDIGTIKYSPETMFWIGYIYRYWAYVYEYSSKQIYKICNADMMNKLYGPYHTMDPKAAIDRILEEKGLVVDDSYEKQYEKYKQFVKERGFEYKI